MNIRVFSIRLAKEFCQSDQDDMNRFLDSVDVKLASTTFVTTGTKDYWSATVFYMPKVQPATGRKDKPKETDLLPEELKIFNALCQWRNELSKELNCPAYQIAHNSHLIAIAQSNPKNSSQLEQVTGLGKAKLEKFGDAMISVLKAI